MKIFTYTKSWNSNILLNPGDSLQVLVTGFLKESGRSQYLEAQSISFSSKVGVVWPE